MKKIVLIILPLLTFVLCLSLANASGVIKKNATYEGERLTISLYNGRECETAKVVMQTSGTTTLAYFQIKVEWDTPSGYHREEKFSAHPGKRYTHEATICMDHNDKPGTGVLRVACGWDEVLYTEFAFDGKYIKFGESYKPSPSVDIDIENEVNVTTPSEASPSERRPKENTRTSAVFNIKSTPLDTDLYIDGNFVGNTPARVELSFGKHVIEVKRKGYKTWKKELQVSVGGEFNLNALLEKELLPGDVWQEPTIGIEFVWIPKGCFNMGSRETKKEIDKDELPLHEVCVDGFWMSKYEITNKQFRMFKPSHNSGVYQNNYTLNENSQPVVNITWDEARAFAKWFSDRTGNTFRLPTEAEWEYACRAGTQTEYFWGDNTEGACQYANVIDLSTIRKFPSWYTSYFNCDDGYVVTSPVGSFKPNGFGLYDMIGNVGEMVEDHYSFYKPTAQNNPLVKMEGTNHYSISRGGSWDYGAPSSTRCAKRRQLGFSYTEGTGKDDELGFRLVKLE